MPRHCQHVIIDDIIDAACDIIDARAHSSAISRVCLRVRARYHYARGRFAMIARYGNIRVPQTRELSRYMFAAARCFNVACFLRYTRCRYAVTLMPLRYVAMMFSPILPPITFDG